MMRAVAAGIVDAIINDLSDRGALDGAWSSIDEDLQEEIRDEWIDLVLERAEANGE